MNKRFTKSLVRPYKKMLATSSPKLKAFFVVLVIMVVSELYLNNAAVSRLISADTNTLTGVFRSMIIALFLTAILIAFNFYGGDRCKRFYHSWRTEKNNADPSMLLIAIIAPAISLILTIVISYIRYSVGNVSTTENIQLPGSAQASTDTAAVGFAMPEVVLLAAVLIAAIVFSYVYSFVNTDPFDLAKMSNTTFVEEKIALIQTEVDISNVNEFTTDSNKLLEELASGIEARAKDQVLSCLLSLCNDPAVATRVYNNVVTFAKQKTTNKP